jgi:hypothetical protein
MRCLPFIVCFECLILSANANNQDSIFISNQSEFDNMGLLINGIINNNEEDEHRDINIIIEDGVYRFGKEQYIEQKKQAKLNINLKITAEHEGKVFILAAGKEFSKEQTSHEIGGHYVVPIDKYNRNNTFIDQDLNLVQLGTTGDFCADGINFASDKPMVIDTINRLMRVRLPSELEYISNRDKEYFKHSGMYFSTQWFDSRLSNLYSDSVYIYGNYRTNNAIEGGYYDENYGKKTRIYVVNVPDMPLKVNRIMVRNDSLYIPSQIRKVYVCDESRAFIFANINLNRLEISKLEFVGNGFDEMKELLRFINCDNLFIINNRFRNIMSKVISIEGRNLGYNNGNQHYASINISLNHNYFKDNGSSICSIYGADSVSVTNNYSENNGIIKKNYTFQLPCKDFYFANNVIKNFPCNALYISTTRTASNTISGIVEYNEFYNTDDYNAQYIRNSLIDVGIIYGGAHNNRIIVKNNVLHDYQAYANFRGIFFDSGAYNVTVENNFLYNINAMYLIDLRYVDPVKNQIRPTCTGNLLKNNVILGAFRWMGNPQDRVGQTIIEDNFVNVYPVDKGKIIIKDAFVKGEIYINALIQFQNGKLYLPDKIKRKYQSIPFLYRRLK